MEINDKYREALDRITTKMLSYDKYEYIAKLEKQEEGKFSRIVNEHGLDLTFDNGDYSNSVNIILPDNKGFQSIFIGIGVSYNTPSKLINEKASSEGGLYCPITRLIAA